MSATTPIGWKEFPCPACGYDLRARTSPRCPECGAEVRDLVRSHIPWVHRRQLGYVRAFLRTVKWACLSPSRLTGDLIDRTSGRAARSFHRICLWLGTLMGMAFVLIAYAMNSKFFRNSLSTGVPADGVNTLLEYLFPALALVNSYWGLIPLFLSCFISLALALRLLQRFIGFLSGNPRQRRNVHRLGHYAAALLLPEILLIGLIVIFGIFLDTDRPSGTSLFLEIPMTIFTLTAMGLFTASAGAWVWRTGSNRMVRIFVMLFLYPPVVLGTAILVTGIVFWACGYAAIAINSMLAR